MIEKAARWLYVAAALGGLGCIVTLAMRLADQPGAAHALGRAAGAVAIVPPAVECE